MTTYSTMSSDIYGRDLIGDGRTTTLDDVMGLSEPPVRVTCADGVVTVTTLPGVHAPESLPDDDELIRAARADGWEPLTGYSGQHSYRGPVLHPSEFIGGALARHILSTPGDYAVATADDPETGEPSGWVVLYRKGTCRECDDALTGAMGEREDMCASCVHDARRSGADI